MNVICRIKFISYGFIETHEPYEININDKFEVLKSHDDSADMDYYIIKNDKISTTISDEELAIFFKKEG